MISRTATLVLGVVLLAAGCASDAPPAVESGVSNTVAETSNAVNSGPDSASVSGDDVAPSTEATVEVASSLEPPPNSVAVSETPPETPLMTETEIAELERQLDEIDALLADIEADFDAD